MLFMHSTLLGKVVFIIGLDDFFKPARTNIKTVTLIKE